MDVLFCFLKMIYNLCDCEKGSSFGHIVEKVPPLVAGCHAQWVALAGPSVSGHYSLCHGGDLARVHVLFRSPSSHDVTLAPVSQSSFKSLPKVLEPDPHPGCLSGIPGSISCLSSCFTVICHTCLLLKGK